MAAKPQKSLRTLVNEIVADGQLTKAEKKRLDAAILADNELDQEELDQLHRVMAMIRKGELKVVD